MTPPAISTSSSCSNVDVGTGAADAATTTTTTTTTTTLSEKNDDKSHDGEHQKREIVVLKRRIVNGIVTVVVGDNDDDDDPPPSSSPPPHKKLSLLFLGCESQAPYGPYEHTATLFMDLLCRSIQQQQQQNHGQGHDGGGGGGMEAMEGVGLEISITVYHTSAGEFPTPTDIDQCDGVILPGSYNAAYEPNVDWIEQLKGVIQHQLIPKQKPTLGVCFGHQVYAQSYYPDGGAAKCPAGSQAGRKPIYLTDEGKQFMMHTTETKSSSSSSPTTTLDLFYSHGDMVKALPPNAVSLGGNDKVPIQAAVYYDTSSVPQMVEDNGHSNDNDNNSNNNDNNKEKKVVAVTFQAHPEYAGSTDRGLQHMLLKIIQLMSDRGDITDDDCQTALKDAQASFTAVEQQSIDVMTISGKLLGWFP